jgi:hypothetical protein
MNEAAAVVVGSFVMAMAAVFVAAHYRQEQTRRKRLRQMGRHHF